ncbi:hypothetical protein MMC22_007129 [Lobaria immixta]|nr:hypothetical protein [Lobaria immixta]
MPPHHPLWGHLAITADIFRTLPPVAHGNYLGDEIRKRYPTLNTAFYLDNWPLSPLILNVLNSDMMYQLTQANLIPKHESLRHFVEPLTDGPALVTLEGSVWKRWRATFNPGFSLTHIMTLVPSIVEEMVIFKNILRAHAVKGEMFHLEELTLNVSIDIIGRVVMDHKFNSQSAYNDLTSALRKQLEWCTIGIEINPLEYFNFLRPLVHLYNTRRMNRYLSRELDNRYETVQDKGKPKVKSVVDLALNSYLAENPTVSAKETATSWNKFKDFAMAQIKLFIFAGHDTTSTGSCFAIHLLSKNPDILTRLRAEHDTVFGDVATTTSVLCSKPHLLNELPFTLAVIKETLRLHPAAAALRAGQPNFSLTGPTGQQFPTKGCLVWGDHHGVHHNPEHWPRPYDFIPERWLVPEGDPLQPPKYAWRPFEYGPRSCIGRELALLEFKIMLVLTVREIVISDMYHESDMLKGNPGHWNLNGERAYMIRRGGGHPSDYYPCKATFTEEGKKQFSIEGFAVDASIPVV